MRFECAKKPYSLGKEALATNLMLITSLLEKLRIFNLGKLESIKGFIFYNLFLSGLNKNIPKFRI